jgi:hypothetical protein
MLPPPNSGAGIVTPEPAENSKNTSKMKETAKTLKNHKFIFFHPAFSLGAFAFPFHLCP